MFSSTTQPRYSIMYLFLILFITIGTIISFTLLFSCSSFTRDNLDPLSFKYVRGSGETIAESSNTEYSNSLSDRDLVKAVRIIPN